MANPEADDFFLWQALALFLLVGALLGVLLGLLLILRPQLMQRINRVANRWISTRYLSQALDRSISIEHWFYQHHRSVGMLAALGAGYILVYFGLMFDKAATLQRLAGYSSAGLLEGLLDSLVLAALTGGAVALFTGLILWLRPSFLRGIEEEANQWVSMRRATKVFDVPHGQFDIFVLRHTRQVGWLLLLGSLYLLFVLVHWLV